LVPTVKDIAKKIQRPSETLQAASDRLRNWTKEGLIKTVGERHPGTGRARKYPHQALVDAVLLQVLTDCTGISAVNAAPLVKEAKQFLQKVDDRKFPLLVISRSVGETGWRMGRIDLSEISDWFEAKANDTHTIIDLQIFGYRIGSFED
jgi:hypothetical protein